MDFGATAGVAGLMIILQPISRMVAPIVGPIANSPAVKTLIPFFRRVDEYVPLNSNEAVARNHEWLQRRATLVAQEYLDPQTFDVNQIPLSVTLRHVWYASQGKYEKNWTSKIKPFNLLQELKKMILKPKDTRTPLQKEIDKARTFSLAMMDRHFLKTREGIEDIPRLVFTDKAELRKALEELRKMGFLAKKGKDYGFTEAGRYMFNELEGREQLNFDPKVLADIRKDWTRRFPLFHRDFT